MTSVKEQKRTATGAAAGVHWYEIALYAGLVALVIGAAIIFAVTRGGEEESFTAPERTRIDEPTSGVSNIEPWGEPDHELLEEILNPAPPVPASVAAGTEAVMVEIGGVAIAEPLGTPDAALLDSILDPERVALGAMEPVGEPDAALLDSILDPEGAALRAMEPVGEPDAALLDSILNPGSAAFTDLEPTGRPDYERLSSILGAPYAEPVAGPR